MEEIRNMKNPFFHLAVLAVILFFSGCAPRGFLYTKTTMPLDVNLSKTSSGLNHAKGNIKQIHYYVDVRWDSNSFGDIARQNGFETVYFADLETLSILGIWTQQIVHVYGK